MLSLPPSVRIHVASKPTDMRKSFDGLVGLVRSVLEQDPLSGHIFVFLNKKADKVKLLYWDRTGLVIVYKRLEKGSFRFPSKDAPCYELEAPELALLLEGIDLAGSRRRDRVVVKSRRTSFSKELSTASRHSTVSS